MESKNIVVTKLTDGDFLRKLENAIQVYTITQVYIMYDTNPEIGSK